MPVMHPVVARDYLARLRTGQHTALQALKRGVRWPGPHDGPAKVAADLRRLLGDFGVKPGGVRRSHGGTPKRFDTLSYA
jgi:hypothetical protein